MKNPEIQLHEACYCGNRNVFITAVGAERKEKATIAGSVKSGITLMSPVNNPDPNRSSTLDNVGNHSAYKMIYLPRFRVSVEQQ